MARWRVGRTTNLEADRKTGHLSRLDTKWTGSGINPRSGQAKVGCPNLWFFWGCPYPSPWQVQRSSGVFSETRINTASTLNSNFVHFKTIHKKMMSRYKATTLFPLQHKTNFEENPTLSPSMRLLARRQKLTITWIVCHCAQENTFHYKRKKKIMGISDMWNAIPQQIHLMKTVMLFTCLWPQHHKKVKRCKILMHSKK